MNKKSKQNIVFSQASEKHAGTETLTENIAVSAAEVSRTFPDGTRALSAVSFKIQKGDFVVIAGSNGSGKSVLMSLIAGLDSPSAGFINTAGHVGLVFQDADVQILGETPEEDVSFGPRNLGLKKDVLADRVTNALEQCGLSAKKDAPARMLSGGEKRRLAVAGILAMDCSIVIFDEPFANLDWPGIQQVHDILSKLQKEKKTIIVLTHELEKCLAMADRFIILDKGCIRFDGTPACGMFLDLEQWGIRKPTEFLWI